MVRRGLGQLPDLGIAEGVMYIQVDTPLGSFAVDPFAASQSPTTQAVMQALGIHVTIGFGPTPEPAQGASLTQNVGTLGLVAGAALLYYLARKR